MPLLRNPDKSKLSKRKNPTSIGYYQAMGYLPEALVNYLGLMGWSLPSGEEKFSLQEMTDCFDLERVSLGGPVFDTEKLDWLNGKYIREDLSDDEFAQKFAQWAFDASKVKRIIPLLKQRVERFSDVAELGSFFISGLPKLDVESFQHKQLSTETLLKILQFSLWRLQQIKPWNRDNIELELQTLATDLGLKIREFLFPLFVAISGKAVSTSVFDSMAILELDICRARIRHAIAVLRGISKKQAKALEREYKDLK